jgi:adenylylsulfate kinase
MSGGVAFVVGLPSSGKSTFAGHVVAELRRRRLPACLLDGDEVRAALGSSIGYDEKDRDAFYGSLGRLAVLLARQGLLVVVAATAHLRRHRAHARAGAPVFLEVLVDADLATCEERDTKGLYRRARKGDLPAVPGIGVPFEPPERAEVVAAGGHDHDAVLLLADRLQASLSSGAARGEPF